MCSPKRSKTPARYPAAFNQKDDVLRREYATRMSALKRNKIASTENAERLRGVFENWEPVAAPAFVRNVRARRLLRFEPEQTRDQAFSFDRTPDHQILRAGRTVGLLLPGRIVFRDIAGGLKTVEQEIEIKAGKVIIMINPEITLSNPPRRLKAPHRSRFAKERLFRGLANPNVKSRQKFAFPLRTRSRAGRRRSKIANDSSFRVNRQAKPSPIVPVSHRFLPSGPNSRAR
jgi:hypothetical protein